MDTDSGMRTSGAMTCLATAIRRPPDCRESGAACLAWRSTWSPGPGTGLLKKLLMTAFCVALAFPSFASPMGLLPKSEGQAAWEALQGRVLGALGGSCAGVKQPAERVSAISVPDATRDELAVNKVVAATLHPMDRVKYVLGPQKKQDKPKDAGGLLALAAPVTGIYVLGSVSHAWIDLVDQDHHSFVRARHYEWVDFCGRRMKAGIFDLRAGARYWIQMSASPDPALDLFVAGPLD
jgi:hypothetical protein